MASATNVGPLITIFTPPSNCLNTITSATGTISVSSYSLFINHWGDYSPGDSCYPSTTTFLDFYGWYYYSPGVCPKGWTTACAFTATPFASSITASLCCPNAYECVNGWPVVCQSTADGVPLSDVAVITANTPFDPSDLLTTVTPASGDIVWGNGIPVLWQSTDTVIPSLFGLTPSAPSATLSTASATSSGISTASATSTGLSSAAKGGIGGGVAAGALLIIVLAVWYFWQKRRSSGTFPDKDPEHEKSRRKAAAELPLGRHHERSELGASPNQVSELTGDQGYRPRPPIESMPVTAPPLMQAVVGDSEQMQNARLSGPEELEWPRDGDFCSFAAS